MFSKRVNMVIKMVNYFTLTLSKLSKLSLPCIITQYTATPLHHGPIDRGTRYNADVLCRPFK